MSILHRFAALALAVVLLAPLCAHASDDDGDSNGDDNSAFSGAATYLHICGGEGAFLAGDACKDGSLAQQAKKLDSLLQAALAKAPATIRPLLKRDQFWFGEKIAMTAGDGAPHSVEPANLAAIANMLGQRIATLEGIAEGFPRAGVLGKWDNAFGSVTVTMAGGDAYRIAIDTDSGYTKDDDRRWRCQATAVVKQTQDGWLAGTLVLDAKPNQAVKPDGDDDAKPQKPLAIKMRRQGETLRIVGAKQDWKFQGTPSTCRIADQITASYFANGKAETAPTSDKIAAGFVAPTFDCTRPVTESDEEICADPDLADNDQRLNRAWKTLLPRLDEATRRALIEDQRKWVRQQAGQVTASLHAGKMDYDLHDTFAARDDLGKLQRRRIALLEGFDEHRKGLAGVWLNYTASLNVTETPDGTLKTQGWKWDQSDWKYRCTYEMEGKLVNGVFRSNAQRTNPDTLERDHTLLIVNRLDDVFAAKRQDPVGSDEPKCSRRYSNSSTARLFPAKASPDIDNFVP